MSLNFQCLDSILNLGASLPSNSPRSFSFSSLCFTSGLVYSASMRNANVPKIGIKLLTYIEFFMSALEIFKICAISPPILRAVSVQPGPISLSCSFSSPRSSP